MHVTKEGIDRLKAANPLEVILADRGIELRKKGRVVVARCPFHEEKTASFTVTPAKGLYHCFGCGARGDVFGFGSAQSHVHARMRTEDQIGQHVGVKAAPARDGFERRRVGQFLALIRLDNMTQGTTRLCQALAACGVRCPRALCGVMDSEY